MIGQKQVINNINELINTNRLPHFLVITGQKGQGKTTVVKYIANKLDCQFIEIEPKVDNIRDMKDIALKISMDVVFDINNGDKMSQSAANSLLKITEECPENVYICLELQQIENTLETIKSRCQEIKMQEYTYEEKMKMLNKLKSDATLEETQVLNKLDNYYQMQKVLEYNPIEFINYADKVYNNIYKVQSANSFKIAEKIDLKDTGEGYDLELFWVMYMNIGIGELFNYAIDNSWDETSDIIDKCISITSKYKNKLKITGINKQSLFDCWVLDVRKEWLK